LKGTNFDVGFLVAVFSIGRLLVTTPFGYASERYGHKICLKVALSIQFIGCLVFANSYYSNQIGLLYFQYQQHYYLNHQ